MMHSFLKAGSCETTGQAASQDTTFEKWVSHFCTLIDPLIQDRDYTFISMVVKDSKGIGYE
jgi:hypothetical protein